MRPASVSQVPIGGSACGYQELLAALAIATTTGQAGGEPYIYTLLHLVRTPVGPGGRPVGRACAGPGRSRENTARDIAPWQVLILVEWESWAVFESHVKGGVLTWMLTT